MILINYLHSIRLTSPKVANKHDVLQILDHLTPPFFVCGEKEIFHRLDGLTPPIDWY